MHAPFLDVVAHVLAGRSFRVLRFNTRGTGGSEGSFGGGTAEARDLAAAWAALDHGPRALAGWSFGARLVMAHAAESRAPVALFAPPLRDDGSMPPLSRPAGPALAVVGSRDQFVDAQAVERFLGSPPVVLAGCDHFFIGGFAEKAALAAADFFDREL